MNEEDRVDTQSSDDIRSEEPSVTPDAATESTQAPENAFLAEAEDSALAPKNDKIKKLANGLFDYVELFAWSVLTVLIIFTFGIRLCRVDGESMENTLHDKQMLLLYSLAYTPQQDDIIVFHLTKPEANLEKTLVKRVIAVGGQEVEINLKSLEIRVDGELYDDAYDPAEFDRKYTETDIPIDTPDEPMDETEEKAKAYDILMGVSE